MGTGKKADPKMYYRHSGRPGGQKSENFKTLQARIPERIVEKAVWGMIPKKRLGRRQIHHLKVYAGSSTRTARSSPWTSRTSWGRNFRIATCPRCSKRTGSPSEEAEQIHHRNCNVHCTQ